MSFLLTRHLRSVHRPTPSTHRLLPLLCGLLLAMLSAPQVSTAQSCTPENPCMLSFGGSFAYPDHTVGCATDYVDHYRNRFLGDHFDNGTPNDFSDDPVLMGFSTWANLFGNMESVNDIMSLPSVANLQAAAAVDKPYVIHLISWGCQHECKGRTSATVQHLRNQPENWMQSPSGGSGVTFSWCNPNYTLTYGLHPDAGLPGNDGLQALFERNLRHIAGWIGDNVVAIPAKRDHLIGVVIAAETHYGDSRWALDYSPPMLAGFRDYVTDNFGCGKKNPTCLDSINGAYGTTFGSVAEIIPPTAICSHPFKGPYCRDWDNYRNDVLEDHLSRVTEIFIEEGVPADLLFGHDLKAASGFVPGPLEIPNRHPGLTSYNPNHTVFEEYGDCTPTSGGCREWAIAEGFMSTSTCGNQDPACFADDLDRIFAIDARFMHVMRRGVHPVTPGGNPRPLLLGSAFEKGIHLWGMRYSDAYSSPQANLTFDPQTATLSGCVYDLDSVWMGPFDPIGSLAQGLGSDLDLNNVTLEISIEGQTPTVATALVEDDQAPWCGAGGINFNHTLSGWDATESFVVRAIDYPTDDPVQVFCWLCDDSQAPTMYVDSPSHNQTISGNWSVSGWAIDASGVASFAAAVDGTPVTLSGFVDDIPRGAVCTNHPQIPDPNCPNVGWSGTLNTTGISNGSHTLSITATDNAGNSTVFQRQVMVDNGPTETVPPTMYVDSPSHNQTISGNWSVSGWAIDASGVVSFTAAIDGTPVTLSGFVDDIPRGAVCTNYPQIPDPNCPNVGWSGNLDTTVAANGPHTLTITAIDAVGNSKAFHRQITIQN